MNRVQYMKIDRFNCCIFIVEIERENMYNTDYNKGKYPPNASHNANASPRERELYAKNVFDVIPMGTDGGNKYDMPTQKYSPAEVIELKSIRDSIEEPNEMTVMQKIVSEKTLRESFLSPNSKNANNTVVVWGFVSVAKDIVPFTNNPSECYENCRLDYKGTEFSNPNDAVFAVRFRGKPCLGHGKSGYYIPYSSEFTSVNPFDDKQPFTGSGYIGAKTYVIPEYRIVKTIIPTDGEIYKINPNGHEELYATFNKRHHVFIPVKEGIK